MSWILSEKEIQGVLSLEASKRYEHLVKKVADQQVIWSLWHEGAWALACDESGREHVPVWPHEKYATLCAEGVWLGYTAEPISLEVWLTRWIPGMEKDRRLVSVFSKPEDKGISVAPKKLENDLRDELSKYS